MRFTVAARLDPCILLGAHQSNYRFAVPREHHFFASFNTSDPFRQACPGDGTSRQKGAMPDFAALFIDHPVAVKQLLPSRNICTEFRPR